LAFDFEGRCSKFDACDLQTFFLETWCRGTAKSILVGAALSQNDICMVSNNPLKDLYFCLIALTYGWQRQF
jgi:hypothetical protein